MKYGFYASIALSVLGVSQVAFAAPEAPKLKPFSYRMKLPAVGASCEDQARSVAKAFGAVATEAKAVTGVCQNRQSVTSPTGETYELDVILINYVAQSEQHPDHTIFGANSFLDKADAGAGVFATFAECVSQIAAQSPLFIAKTELVPFAAYCQASTNSMYPGFSLTFETMGQFKKMHLYTFSLDGQANWDTDGSQVTQAALVGIQVSGGQVAWKNSNRIFYYYDYPISISNQAMGVYYDAAQCNAQVAMAHSIFAKAEMKGASAFCLVSPPPAALIGKAPDAYVLMAVGASVGPSMILDTSEGRYDSFAECMDDIARIEQNAVSSGKTAYGVICAPNTYEQGGFDARLFPSLF
jgi:hypothetical protein